MINTRDYNLTEKHALGDLIANYAIYENGGSINPELPTDITEDKLTDFYNNVYRHDLQSKYCLIDVNGTFKYGKFDKSLNTNDYYCSTHVLIGRYKVGYAKAFDTCSLSGKPSDLKDSPYATKIVNPFTKSYYKVDSFRYMLSKLFSTMDNKYCYFDPDAKLNICYIPDLGNDINSYINYYIKFISNKNIDSNLLKRKEKKDGTKVRCDLQYTGNFGDSIYRLSNLKDVKLLDAIIRLSDIENNVQNISRKQKLNVKGWYKVTHNSIDRIKMNQYISSFIVDNKRNYKELFSEFIPYESDFDKREKNGILLWKFIIRFNTTYLEKLLKKNILFSENNSLLDLFIKTNFKMKEEQREIVKEFTKSLGNTLYFKAKGYVCKQEGISEKNNLPQHLKDSVEVKKEKMIKDINHLLKKSKDMITFLAKLSDYYGKHKIYNNIMDLTEYKMDYREFSKLVKIYLRTKLNNQ